MECPGVAFLKTGDTMPQEFKVAPLFIRYTIGNQRTLGHIEGWTTESVLAKNKEGKEITVSIPAYSGRYVFMVYALVSGDPDTCPEAQFTKGSYYKGKLTYDPTTGHLDSQTRYSKMSSYMFIRNDIVNVKKLLDLKLPNHEGAINSQKDIEGLIGCHKDSSLVCADGYTNEVGGPGNNKDTWVAYIKKHFDNSGSGKIMWIDFTGVLSPAEYIKGAANSKNPWTINSGAIDIRDVNQFYFDAINIIENSAETQRFVCFLEDLVIKNRGSEATNTQKHDVVEPSCYCIEQKRAGGKWEIIQGKDNLPCGLAGIR